jgi:hypothetical protein
LVTSRTTGGGNEGAAIAAVATLAIISNVFGLILGWAFIPCVAICQVTWHARKVIQSEPDKLEPTITLERPECGKTA